MKTVKSIKQLSKVMLGTLLLSTSSSFSQSLGIKEAADSLFDEVRGAAPIILAVIFLVSVLMNIGKVSGADRDYKGFFIGMFLWLGGITIIGGILTYILSLSF